MSDMMTKLYGDDNAQMVYDRCQELGNDFNTLVQDLVYEQFWSRPGTSVVEKSLAAVTSLAALKKSEQLKIHFIGLINQGVCASNIAFILQYMHKKDYLDSTDTALDLLTQVSGETIDTPTEPEQSILDIIDCCAHIAIGDNAKTKQCIENLFARNAMSEEKMRLLMIHQIFYCGFPCGMNGFAILFDLNNR